MARPIQVEVDVKSAAAIGAFAGIASSVASAGLAIVNAGIDAAVDAIGDSIELASNKAEAASKVNVLFGQSADLIEQASTKAATSVGLSSGAYLEAAGNVGNLITNLGFSGDAAANMSNDIVSLSADLGSFNNLPTDQAVEAIGAAFRGESEPIRAFGVLIDDASIKAKALELGLYSGVGALDKNARATATYQLILEQTTSAQGDFARTSDGLANSQRINAARLEDAWTRVGEKLEPIAQAVLPMLADGLVGLVDGIGEIIDAAQDWIADNQDLVDTLVDLGRLIWDNLVRALQIAADVVGELGYRVGGIIGLFIDLASAIVDVGAAMVKVFSGDFAGAGADAERAFTHLQGVQENVQRAIGDGARKQADLAAAVARDQAQTQEQIWSDAQDAQFLALAGIEVQAGESGAAAGQALTDRTAGAIDAGTDRVAGAAGDMADTLPQALTDAQVEANRIAARTPGEIAGELRDHRGAWQDALDTLGDDLKHSMTTTQEIAKLQAALTGKELARGLESSDPIVRAQADATVAAIESRLKELRGVGSDAAANMSEAFVTELNSSRANMARAAERAALAVQDRLELHSPAKAGPWSERGGPFAWARLAGRGIAAELGAGLQERGISPPQLSAGVLGRSGAPGGITVNVSAGVGDPVAIGREVSEVLRAYQRASGTEVSGAPL